MKPLDTGKLRKFIDEKKNIADKLDDDVLKKISSDLLDGITYDAESRQEWSTQMKDALSIARQDITPKNYPWDNASNVKVPLILNACIQFNARISPEIIQGNKIVHVAVMRDDPDGSFGKVAYNQSRHMSYQLLDVVKNWLPDTDKLLMTLPLLGTVYRKTYFDPIHKIPRVDFCLPDDVIINQGCSALEYSERITHAITLTQNQLIERMRAGIYTHYDLKELRSTSDDTSQDFDEENITVTKSVDIERTIHDCYECSCWLDLDEDEYKEPYLVTIHKDSAKILRIMARFDNSSWIKDGSNIIGIDGKIYFTDYHFMPSIDGSFMGLGFGQFLYPLNEAINSVTNSLLDSGHLANMQGGFISRALKLTKEKLKFQPGQWRMVNSPSGIALNQAIMPLPTKEPSQTLFNLLQFLLQSAKELSAISEPMQGQLPPANTPATTVLAVLQQGQKVYSSVFHRLYHGLKKEYEKLYELNAKYLKTTENYRLAKESGMVSRETYDKKLYGVFPVADPNISSDTERLTKLQALWNIKDDPNINEREVVMRYVSLLRISDEEKLINPPPDPKAPPPPEVQVINAQIRNLDAQTGTLVRDTAYKAEELLFEEKRLELNAIKASVDASSKNTDSIIKFAELEMAANQQVIEAAAKGYDLISKQTAAQFGPFENIMPPQQQMQQQQQQAPNQMQQQQQQPVSQEPQGAPEKDSEPPIPPPVSPEQEETPTKG